MALIQEQKDAFNGSSIVVRWWAPNIVESRVEGILYARFCPLITHLCDLALIGQKSILSLHDWYGVESYETETRNLLTHWVIANVKAIEGSRLVVHSKMVAMGVATAALVTGMQAQGRAAVYTDPREFAEMRAKAIGP